MYWILKIYTLLGNIEKFVSLNIVDNGFIFTPSRAYGGGGVILRARKGTFTT